MAVQHAEERANDRKHRSFWFDPRFAIGLLLVVLSVLGVVWLVSAANSSVVVLAARSTLIPGERVTSSDLVPVSVRTDQLDRLYLSAKDVPTAGIVVTRAVAAGELVPHSAVGSVASENLTSVVVSLGSVLSSSVGPGDRVDLWSAAQAATTDGDAGSFDAPTVLVSSAIVVRTVDQKTLVSGTPGSTVELLIPKESTAGVLDAIANGAALSVVPVDLPLGQ